MVGEAVCRRQSLDEILRWSVGFQRILRRNEPPNLIETKGIQADQTDLAMSRMGWIKGAAEQADSHPRHCGREPERVGRRRRHFRAVRGEPAPTP